MSVTNRLAGLFLLGMSAPLFLGASAAYAQSACNAVLPAFTQAMKAGTREALQGYLDAHAPCFEGAVQAKLTALGGAPESAPAIAAPDPAPPPPAAEPPKPMDSAGATVPGPAVDPTCAQYANARSERWDQPVSLRVVNRGAETLTVNWIDYDGVRQPAGTVEPGGVFGGGTYVTHPFEFVAPDGACVHILMPQVGIAEYNVGQ